MAGEDTSPVPVYDPRGRLGIVPSNQLDDAIGQGYKRADDYVQAIHPTTGMRGIIPVGQWEEAQKQGYTQVPVGKQPITEQNMQTSIAPTVARAATATLPVAGGAIGAMLGSAGGPAGTVGGSALGGSAGEASRQLANKALFGLQEGPQTSSEAAGDIFLSGGISAALEVPGAIASGYGNFLLKRLATAKDANQVGDVLQAFGRVAPSASSAKGLNLGLESAQRKLSGELTDVLASSNATTSFNNLVQAGKARAVSEDAAMSATMQKMTGPATAQRGVLSNQVSTAYARTIAAAKQQAGITGDTVTASQLRDFQQAIQKMAYGEERGNPTAGAIVKDILNDTYKDAGMHLRVMAPGSDKVLEQMTDIHAAQSALANYGPGRVGSTAITAALHPKTTAAISPIATGAAALTRPGLMERAKQVTKAVIPIILFFLGTSAFAQTSVTGRWGVGAFATRPAACGSGDTWTDTDDANSYKCFPNGTWNTITGGGGGSPGGVSGDVQLNISGSFGNVSGFNYHSAPNILFMPFGLAIQGPSPWVDITSVAYGARAVSIHTTGTGSSTSLTVGVSTFQNGDGITIVGGGSAPTMSTPGAPTVVPGESESETVVDAHMTAGVSGSSTYKYCILAEDLVGGVTICSPTTTITTGNATLGSTSVSLSAISLTGNTLSFTSSAAHGLVQYALAHITSGANSYYLSGWFPIQTITDTTHAGSVNTVVGTSGTQSAASGTLVYFMGNNVTWSTVTGAYRYWVCAQRPGDANLHIIGTALPGTTQFVDFGFNMNQPLPWYMADANCTAGSAQNQLSANTVSAGGGTTSLTLTNGLTNSVTGAATRQDNHNAINAAATAAAGSSAIFIPPGTFEINTLIGLPGNLGVIQDGTITANAPILWLAAGQNSWSGLPYRGNTAAWPFDPQPTSLINCNTSPCLDFFHFSSLQNTLSNVGLIGNDNGVLVANAAGFTNGFNHVKLETGTDNNDNMGIAFWGPSGMPVTTECDNCSFAGGPNQNIDQTWAPLVYVEGNGGSGDSGMIIRSAVLSRRGIFAKYSAGSGGAFVLDGLYRQGGITPFLAIENNNGNNNNQVYMNQVHMDSEQQAGFALWGGNGTNMFSAYILDSVNNPQSDGGGNPSFVTGSGSQSSECIGERIGDLGPNGSSLQCTGFTFNGLNGQVIKATNPLNMGSNLFTASTETVNTSLLNSGFFDVTETAAPANPASGNERWYANSTTHNLSCLTSAGGNCSPGGSAPTLQTNSVNNSTQNLLNLINSTTNATGLVLTDTNTSGGIVQAEISGTVNLASGGCAGSSALTCFNNISLMTSLGDLLYGGAGGSETRLQGPGVGTALPYVLEDIPSGGSATAPQWGILGVPVPATQTGAFTFSGAGSAGTLSQADQLNDILANPSAPSTYTIPATSALNFNNNPAWSVFNENATNTVTFSSSSTIIGDTVALPLWQTRITQQAGSSSYIIRSYPSMGAWGSTCTTKAIQWSTTSGILCNQLSLTTGVTGTLPIANGGTNGVTQQAALNNIAPSAIRAGDIIYYNGTNWTNLGGNNAGTQFLSENGSGVPSWSSGTTTTPLQSVTAALGSATIANANNPIVWNWAQTTASQYGFTFGETAAKTGAGGGSLLVQTQAGSTGIPATIINSLTGSQTLAALTVTPTWNTTGVVDAGILENVTNTASGAASLLMDLQVGGSSKFKVDKAGLVNGLAIPAAAGTATFAQLIASGTAAMGTSAISSGTCATVVTSSATGVATTDTIKYTPNTDPTAVTGYGPSATGSLYVWAYPTSNNVNFKVCNNTSASITPSALTFNWEVTR